MNPLIVVGLLVGLPVVLISLLRSNAGVVFLALCAGSVMATFLGEDVMRVVLSFVHNTSEGFGSGIKIALMLVPAVLSTLFLKRTMKGPKQIMNLIPTLLTGLATAILVMPLLPKQMQFDVATTAAWQLIDQFQGFIIGASVFMSMVMLWSTHKSNSKHRGKH